MVGAILLILASGNGPTTPRIVVAVEASDCSAPSLRETSREVLRTLKEQLGTGMFDEVELATKLGSPYVAMDLAELQKQLVAARQQHYRGEYVTAWQTLNFLLVSLEKLAPSKERWDLTVATQLLVAQNHKLMNRPKDTEEAFKAVLRLAPNTEMDANLYPPSTRAAFEAVRKQVNALPKYSLTVTSMPVGAEAFIDGLPIGKTPATASLVAGSYTIGVSLGDKVSLPHTVRVDGQPTSIEVDLGFESQLRMKQFSCIEVAEEGRTLATAAKLAAVLSLQQTILLRFSKDSVRGRLVGLNGEKIREGLVAIGGAKGRTDGEDLVHFLLTGEGRGVVVPENARVAAEQTAKPKVAQVTARQEGGLRARVLIPTIAAGLLLVGSAVTYAMMKTVAADIAAGNNIADVAALNREVVKGSGLQTASAILLGAGLVSAGLAVILQVVGWPEDRPVAFSVSANPTGAFMSFAGVFP